MSIMKQKILYAITVIVILAVVLVGFAYFSPVGKWICGPCGCFGDECGGGGYVPNSCSDSDGGLVYTTKGAVSGYSSGYYYNIADFCRSDSGITEYYCQGTKYKSVTAANCSGSTPNCVCGACIDCKCSDGTRCKTCSTNKPKYCDASYSSCNPISLIDKCSICGCPSATPICNADGTCSAACRCSDGTPCNSCAITDANKPKWCDSTGNWVLSQCSAPHNCPCPAGQACNAVTGVCVSAPCHCSDGTLCGSCSSVNKPSWCDASGNLIANQCGPTRHNCVCSVNQTCNAATGACV